MKKYSFKMYVYMNNRFQHRNLILREGFKFYVVIHLYVHMYI